MVVIAKSVLGREFMYNAKSAHKAPKASAQMICDALNREMWQLKTGEVWFVHEVDKYDSAYEYAQWQSFHARKGTIKRTTSYGGWM